MTETTAEVKPTIDDWRSLYEAAIAFKQNSCWNWMNEDHIFGLQNPFNGEIGYCCVLGQLGEVYALSVYLGAGGLAGITRMQQQTGGKGSFDMIELQKCLMASFDDRNRLDSSSLKMIKELGMKFRGANAWPNFVSMEPGYLPWKLTSQQEVQFLTIALEQTIEVSKQYQFRMEELATREDGQMLILKSEGDLQQLTWTAEWRQPPGIEDALKPKSINPIFNELLLTRLLKNVKYRSGIWEIDAFFAPMPINEEPRPYFPNIGLILDQNSEQIVHHVLAQGAGQKVDLAEEFLQAVSRHLMLPHAVWVEDEEAYWQLQPLMDKLNVQLVQVEELTLLSEAREGMFHAFR
ncbi:MAG: hypothetical protein P0Y55_04155 [Candidatus Cohnella colombiensis]|uniref:GNAT family N-acetyltransferase n=1 Tax=Candidatus Cohnella colombiensis TaxID=3121368 RepID=A0AA95EYT2_9BACL|nr:MAG: hypothetical protein P0Y55_04155 [Cohnella sp.]